MPKKSKKDKRRRRAKRGLPTAVKGLLQYLGGQDATLQGARPRVATGADGGEALNRYLASKAAILDLQRQQLAGANIQQQTEERILAKQKIEQLEKNVSMLSAGLKESDVYKRKMIAQTLKEKEKLERLQRENQDPIPARYFADVRKAQAQGGPYIVLSPASSVSGFGSSVESWTQGEEGGESLEDVPMSVAAEMYRGNAPTERPIIRDRPRRVASVSSSSSFGGGGGGAAALPRARKIPVMEKKAQVSAAELKARISEMTGMSRSHYKLPARGRYADVQSVLNRSASSADLISALKEAGVNLAEA